MTFHNKQHRNKLTTIFEKFSQTSEQMFCRVSFALMKKKNEITL